VSAVAARRMPRRPLPRRRPTARRIALDILAGYLPMVVATLIIALPLLWMVLGSFKPPSDIITQNLVVLPTSPTVDAYTRASAQVDFPQLFLNSAIVTVVGASIKLLLALTTAYALVFIRFPLKWLVFGVILVALMVPPQVSLIPNYTLIASLGGLNTYWGIILPGLGTAFGTFLFRQHFLSLPRELLEAAEMDGAGHLARLFRIIAPVSAPTIATVALVTIVNEWNDYLWPLVVVNRENMMTLPVGLTLLKNTEGDVSSYPVLMAGAVLVIVPVLVLFAFLQRYIVSGLTQGAVR